MKSLYDPAYAHGEPPAHGALRTVPEDFLVREWLGFAADGVGDHWLLTVRKRGANTHWVAKQIAKRAQIHPRDVGFAGLKDRNAITEQSFTVPVRSAVGSQWVGVSGEGFEVVAAERHRRKLKRGALRGNDFEIIVRQLDAQPAAVAQRLTQIAEHGVPNYFGPQRFGIGGANLRRARQWLAGELQLDDRFERGFALSAARAAIFNAVLARRIGDGSWNLLEAGDVANLASSNSVFRVEAVDDVLRERCRTFDIHPTGPLWGRGVLASEGRIAALEQAAAAYESSLSTGLAAAGLDQERRALRLHVTQLEWSLDAGQLRLKFRLPRGAFATAVLHELIAGVFEQGIDETEEE